MEQFRQIGEVLGSLNALMVLQDDITINQRQCSLLLDIFSLAFNTIAEEIRQNLKLEEQNTKWRSLEQPLKELYRVFREGELYVRYCLDNKDWWAKVLHLHHNKDCVEFHIHNLLTYFPTVIEAIETAGEISGLDPSEMQRRRVALSRKYDKEWDDPKLFHWRFGKQYLVPKRLCSRFEHSWREDRWNLIEVLQDMKTTKDESFSKYDKRLAELLLWKLTGVNQFDGKSFPGSILLGAKDYQVRRRLGCGGKYKEIHWLGHSFAMRHFFGEIDHLSSEISTLLSLCHPNISQYLCGFYDEDRKECCLVMELMHKDLQSFIRENCGPRRRVLFSPPVLVDLLLQIARGMHYLHSNDIFHGNLNPSNILLRERNHTEGYFRAKISEFGLSTVKNPTCRCSTKQNVSNPAIWYAPEVLTELEDDPDQVPKTKYTREADVYSFAMVAFALLTAKVPFEDSHLQGEMTTRNIRAGERPLFPSPSPRYLVSLTKRCWHEDPSQRPSFSSICRILRYIQKLSVVDPDYGLPQLQTSVLDYWDLEARFLQKFPSELGTHAGPVNQIPFHIFSYKIAEKEKLNPTKILSLVEGSESASVITSVMEDPLLPSRDTKSLCLDTISEYSDVMSIKSEAPLKNISAFKKSDGTRKLRKSPSTGSTKGQRSPMASPVKTRSLTKATPLSSFGRTLRTTKDNRLISSPMTPGRRRYRGHASDSEAL